MPILDEALAQVLDEGWPPRSLGDALGAYEGRAPRAQLARDLEGIGPGQLPRKGTAERRRYEATKRRVERYTTTAGQRRGQTRPDRGFVQRAVDVARRVPGAQQAITARNIARAARDGVRMRWRAWIQVSEEWRLRTMPASAGNKDVFQHISGDLLDDVLELWREPDREAAGDELAAAFFIAYGIPGTRWREPEWALVQW